MKNFKIFSLLLASLFLAWSCGEEENMDPVGNWELAAPTLLSPSTGTNLELNEDLSDEMITFEWNKAVASNRFQVAYKFYLVPANSEGINEAIMEVTPSNGGKAQTVSVSAEDLDYALWTKCYPAGQAVNLKWVVAAKAIEKEVMASSPVTVTRFATDPEIETMYITGAATEAGEDVSNATPMRARKDAEGFVTGIFDVYTELKEGLTYTFRDRTTATSKVFGGANGSLQPCGTAITAPATGVYRVTVNVNANTYELLKIEKWSLVGDAVLGGWGGDVPLTYKGNSVWQAKVEFFKPYDNAGFIFRANENWGYLLKPISNTVSTNGKTGKVIMESEAQAAGKTIKDGWIDGDGMHTVTLDLKSDAYSFTIVADAVTPGPTSAIIGKSANPDADAVSGNFLIGTYTAPDQLFLVSNGIQVAELSKNGNTFTSKFLALEKSKTYILNSKSDGTGTTYNNVGNGQISVDHDQAYSITVNFETGKLQWKHYNIKLFHWNNEGGWDARNEYPMTYVHPFKFEAKGVALTGGFDSKFNSPWEVQFGTTATALTGTMTNGGENFKGIGQSGNYDATITVSNDFTTAEYAFVKK